MSIARSSGRAPEAMPSGPKVTASTSGELVTIVTTVSDRSATSRGVRTTVAPSFSKGFARSSVRFVTVTGNPAASAFRAIGAPMIPRPTKPTRSIRSVLDVVVAREEHAAVAGLLGDEERALLGHVHVHGRDEKIVGHVDEAGRARELVRDRLGKRILLERIDEQRPRLFHEREEFERLKMLLVGEEDGCSELLVAFMDLVEEHLLSTSVPDYHWRISMQNSPKTLPSSVKHTVRREPGSNVTLGDYLAHGATVEAAPPTDEDVERTIASMRDTHAQLRPVDREARAGDILTVDIDAAVPGKALPPFARNAHIEAGKDLGMVGLGEALVGTKLGDEKKVDLTFPNDASENDLAGKTGTFSIRPSQVAEKILPELDDEFAKTVGVADVAALRKAVRNELAHAAFHEARDEAADKAVEHAMATSNVEIPELLIEDELEHLVNDLKARIKQEGMTWEKFLLQARKTEDKIRN